MLIFSKGGSKVKYPSSFVILGHVNHSFFWKILAPTTNGGGQLSNGKLKSTLEKDFGSVEEFKKVFNVKAAALQGSGWCWLVRIAMEDTEQKTVGR